MLRIGHSAPRYSGRQGGTPLQRPSRLSRLMISRDPAETYGDTGSALVQTTCARPISRRHPCYYTVSHEQPAVTSGGRKSIDLFSVATSEVSNLMMCTRLHGMATLAAVVALGAVSLGAQAPQSAAESTFRSSVDVVTIQT